MAKHNPYESPPPVVRERVKPVLLRVAGVVLVFFGGVILTYGAVDFWLHDMLPVELVTRFPARYFVAGGVAVVVFGFALPEAGGSVQNEDGMYSPRKFSLSTIFGVIILLTFLVEFLISVARS